MKKLPRFPTLAVFLLIAGIFWLLSELGILVFNIPWWPIILIVLSIGWIVDRYVQ